MKKLFSTLLAGAFLAGVTSSAWADHALAHQDIRPGVEPEMFNIDQHDSAMKRAVHEARRTVGVFIQAGQHPKAGEHDFQVKKAFHEGLTVEHLWLSDVSFSGNRFHGYVDNRPHMIKNVKMGDQVSVNPNEISDWSYVDHGRLVGGYTIRVLYGELSPDRKKALEKEARFHIGNQS